MSTVRPSQTAAATVGRRLCCEARPPRDLPPTAVWPSVQICTARSSRPPVSSVSVSVHRSRTQPPPFLLFFDPKTAVATVSRRVTSAQHRRATSVSASLPRSASPCPFLIVSVSVEVLLVRLKLWNCSRFQNNLSMGCDVFKVFKRYGWVNWLIW